MPVTWTGTEGDLRAKLYRRWCAEPLMEVGAEPGSGMVVVCFHELVGDELKRRKVGIRLPLETATEFVESNLDFFMAVSGQPLARLAVADFLQSLAIVATSEREDRGRRGSHVLEHGNPSDDQTEPVVEPDDATWEHPVSRHATGQPDKVSRRTPVASSTQVTCLGICSCRENWG